MEEMKNIGNIIEFKGGLEIHDIPDFNIDHTFLCGQCFRWTKEKNGSFTGVAQGKVLNISQTGKKTIFNNTTLDEFRNVWYNYFDYANDYHAIKSKLSRDALLEQCIQGGDGIRILRQDFFETLISFIISANNNIPRICGIIDRLCRLFGEKIEYNEQMYYTFPTPERLCEVTSEQFAPLAAGYRVPYIMDAVRKVCEGSINPEQIKLMELSEARAQLIKIAGVGDKVCDCVMLFGLGDARVFPTDVRIKRIMGQLYNCRPQDVMKTGQSMFGELAGYAQQYLYYSSA